MLAPLLFAAALAGAPSPPREIAPGVHLLADESLPGRGPDGATILFEAPGGLIVVDTGRHAWRSDAILRFARARGRPIAAIVNTHWHLDHSSGNGRVKADHPGASLYATAAVDRVLAPGGFLSRNLDGARAMLEGGELTEVQREEVQIFIDTMAEQNILRPDVVIERPQRLRIAGRRLELRLTRGAVTEADLWLYDPRTRVAVLGDLVTLPAPFFETACPDRWRAALDEVWRTPFRIAAPGHGAPMTRAEFALYRSAFNAFVDCAEGEAAASACAAAWARDVAPFLAGDERAERAAMQMSEYYVGFLRQHGGASPDCVRS